MLRFVVAAAPEAEPLVRRYRMEPEEGAFRWYRSDEAALAISGIGKTAAAAATSYLHAKTGEEPLAIWINFGTAGHRDRPRGDVLLAHTITDIASGARFHPTRLDGLDLEGVEVKTVERPEVDFGTDAAYDMEAYGFAAAALPFSTAELVQSIKIVSDNRDTTTAAWTPKAVRELVESRLEAVARAASRLLSIALELEPVRREHRESQALVAAYRSRAHFTTSESRKLRHLLRRWAALAPEAVREPVGDEGASASEILEALEGRVDALAREGRP